MGTQVGTLTFGGLMQLFLAIALSAVHGPSVQAQAVTTHSNFAALINDVAFSPCTGENIFLTGRQHVVAHTTVDAQGGVHTRSHLNGSTTGVGEGSGAVYKHTVAINEVFHTIAAAPSEFTFETHNHLISHGLLSNQIIHTIFHMTVNAEGEVTSLTSRARIEWRELGCRLASDDIQRMKWPARSA